MNAEPVIKSYIVFKDGEARIATQEHLKAEIIARMHVDGQASVEDVMGHYGLSRAQVYGALAYYFENQPILDAAYEQSWRESKGINTKKWRRIIEERQSEK